MGPPIPRRLLARPLLQAIARSSSYTAVAASCIRQFSASRPRHNDEPSDSNDSPRKDASAESTRRILDAIQNRGKNSTARSVPETPAQAASSPGSAMADLANTLVFKAAAQAPNKPTIDTAALRHRQLTGTDAPSYSSSLSGTTQTRAEAAVGEPFHLHIYAHKHNTHVTLTRPNREPIVSVSCGNVGFKKSKRSLYDSAYQTVAFALQKLYHAGWHEKIRALEVVFRDFGPGRDAATRCLLSPEGKPIRSKIVKVSDATRLKFGGTRSQNPRRL